MSQHSKASNLSVGQRIMLNWSSTGGDPDYYLTKYDGIRDFVI